MQRVRIEYADRNDSFRKVLPRRGGVVRVLPEISTGRPWTLIKLDEPFEWQHKVGEPFQFRLLKINHVDSALGVKLMPRKPDPTLETRILEAARRLWIKGGEDALSMRAVAQAARTNTPAIYRRFRNRKDILRALVRRVQQELFEVLQACASPEEAGQRTLEFALAHRREYELLTAGLLSRLKEEQPNFEFMKKRCAEWLGGSPHDNTRLVLALWSAVHGTATLLITKTVPKGTEDDLSSVLKAILRVLVQNRAALSSKA